MTTQVTPASEPRSVRTGRPPAFTHEAARAFLFLLPVWVLGAGELARFIWNVSTPGSLERNGLVKGRDFVQFYVAGTLAREHHWNDLYDVDALQAAVARILPVAAGQVPAPLYGPQVALAFAPVSSLSYPDAQAAWLGCSAALYLLSAWVVYRQCPHLREWPVLTWTTILASPALAVLLATGQTGAIACACWALAAVAVRRGSRAGLGAALGLLAWKPPLLAGAVLALLVLRQWRTLGVLLVTASAQMLLAVPWTGLAPWIAYGQSLWRVSDVYFLTDTIRHQKQSLPGFFELLLGSGPSATILSVAGGAVVLLAWARVRARPIGRWVVPMLAATAVLLSPHFYVYDLVVLTAALLIAADAVAARPAHPDSNPAHPDSTRVAFAGYALLYAPFSGVLAERLHVQLSTLALMAFVWALWRMANRERWTGAACCVPTADEGGCGPADGHRPSPRTGATCCAPTNGDRADA